MSMHTCFGKLNIKKRKTIEVFGESHGNFLRNEYEAMRNVLTTRAEDMKNAFELLFSRFTGLKVKPAKIVQKYEIDFEGNKVYLRLLFDQPIFDMPIKQYWEAPSKDSLVVQDGEHFTMTVPSAGQLMDVAKALDRDEFSKFTEYSYLVFSKYPFKIVCLVKAEVDEEFEKKLFRKAVDYITDLNIEEELIKKHPPLFKTFNAIEFLKSKNDAFGKSMQKHVIDFISEIKVKISYGVLEYRAPDDYSFGYDIWGFLTPEEARALGEHIKKRLKEMTPKVIEEKLVKMLGCAGPGYDLSDHYKNRAEYIEAIGNFLMSCKDDEIIVHGSR